MEDDPIGNDARKQRSKERLPPDAACSHCGCQKLEALTLEEVERDILEDHHVVGSENDGLTVVLCMNCHRGATEGLKDGGVEGRIPPTLLHRIANILTALADFFERMGEKCQEWAERLWAFIRELDEHFPAWRELCVGGVQ